MKNTTISNIDFKNNLLKLFYEANKNFLKKHMDNIICDVSERNLCAQLSMEMNLLLEKYQLNGYYSDPEYNRNGREGKFIVTEDGEPKSIVCDLIVHSRGKKQKDNLLAIEMKKIPNVEADIENDRKRLKALTIQECDEYFEFNGNYYPKKVCKYEIGLMYLLDICHREITYEIYIDGEKISKETNSFDEMMNYTTSSFRVVKKV